MISKIFSGHSFGPVCKYVCTKQGVKILEAKGVRAHNPKVMAADFNFQHQFHPEKKQACFHGILSFPPGEGEMLGNKKMLEIAQKYLKEINIQNTQYTIAKHTDKAHIHLHIIANMIDNDGKVIKDNFVGLRGKKAAQKLTSGYKLTPANKKHPHLSHPEALHRYEANKLIVYKAILSQLPFCRNMEDLEKGLHKLGITTLYKYKGQTNERQGVSFKLGKDCFKGSKVDRRFSLGNLEKYFSFQRQQKQNNVLRHNVSYKPIESHISGSGSTISPEIVKDITDLMDALFQQDFEPAYGGSEYVEPIRKKKKKKKRKGLSR